MQKHEYRIILENPGTGSIQYLTDRTHIVNWYVQPEFSRLKHEAKVYKSLKRAQNKSAALKKDGWSKIWIIDEDGMPVEEEKA